jgi:type IV pilus assembly protein PilB
MIPQLSKWQHRRENTVDHSLPAMSLVPSKKPRLGEWLLAQGWITPDQLAVALQEQSHRPERLGELMLELNFIQPHQLLTALSVQSERPHINLEQQIFDPLTVQTVPLDIARSRHLILFRHDQDEKTFHVAMADPEDLPAMDHLREFLMAKYELAPRLIAYHTTLKGIAHALEAYYPHPTVDKQGNRQEGEIIRLVNELILEAVRLRASDIHLSPTPYGVEIHYRQDGMLHLVHTLHKDQWPPLSVRLKIMATLDIAESRRPQNGRFSLTLAGREIDFRLSCHPIIHGENFAIRILDKTHSLRTLHELGFDTDDIILVERLVRLPDGMIILSGPTGAGKTTTLYALLNHMNANSRNIMTLEEPVEYNIPHIRQTEIKEGGPFRFAEGMRSLLRQDPDVIFISEIRDAETAHMAVRAAMTGHLVLGTIHARNTLTIPQRFIDLGVPLALLEGNLTAGISQRLVRKLCQRCRVPYMADTEEHNCFADAVNISPIYKSSGCEDCLQTGYNGRKAIAELRLFNDNLTLRPMDNGSISPANNQGEQSLWNRGVAEVLAGQTTLAEINRVIGEHF